MNPVSTVHPDGGAPPRPGARRLRLAAAALSALGAAAVPAVAVTGPAAAAGTNSFTQTNLIADNATFGAELVDPNLTNPWGLAFLKNSAIWVSDNNSGMATAYTGGIGGGSVSLSITVPVPGGNPTGQVAGIGHGAFPVGGPTGGSAAFIVATDSIGSTQSPGEIAAWNGGASFVVEDSPTGGPGGTTPAGAVFKGLAVSSKPTAGPELFAADVANAKVDIFDKNFAPVSAPTEFVDPAIPAGYAPFGIQTLKNKVYVTYGKQNSTHTDVVPGAGLGYVDVYNPNGVLIKHLIAGGGTSQLDEPWGLAIAPKNFGPFGNDLLVGNLGNGWINAFNAKTGAFVASLDDTHGVPLHIDGLWGLQVGNGTFGARTSLIFSAGPNGYADGLVGVLNPGP